VAREWIGVKTCVVLIAHAKAAKPRPSRGRDAPRVRGTRLRVDAVRKGGRLFLILNVFPRLRDTLTRGFWIGEGRPERAGGKVRMG